MDNTYNGFKNRSTWLAKLHLDNTDLDTYNLAKYVAVNSDTERQFKGRIQSVLFDIKLLWKEQEFKARDIDYNELWDAFRITE